MGFKMRRFVDLPLKYKLILYFLSLIVLSVVLFGLLSYRLVVNQISENTNNLLSDTVYQTTFFLNEKLTTVLEKLVLLENDMVIRNITQQGNAAYTEEQRFRDRMHITTNMDELYAGNPQMIDSIYLKYNNMQEYHLQKDEILRSIEINLQEWLQTYNTSERGYYWLNNHEDTIFRTIKKRNVITVLKTFGTMDSQFNGISVINLRSDYFLDILNNIQVSTNGYIALISPDGIFLSKDVQDPFLIGEQELSLLRNSEKKGSFSVTNRENESLFVVFDSLQVNNWVIAAIVPEGDLFEKTTQIKYLSLIIITVLLIFSSLVATLLAESFSKSIRYLSNQVRKVESGNFNIEFKVQEGNEICILA